MKSVFSLALIGALLCSLSACSTLSNRRALYRPNKPEGPWTKKSAEVARTTWHNKIVDY